MTRAQRILTFVLAFLATAVAADAATDGYAIRGSFATAINAVFVTTPATRSSGDFDTLNMNSKGALHVSIQEAAAGATGLYAAASVSRNAAVAADVNAAVAAAATLRLVGFSCRESAGTAAPATFRIIDGALGSGANVLVEVELAPNESRSDWFWPGLSAVNGLSIDQIAGTQDVELFYTQ